MSNLRSLKVAIVGGGFSGLAAATELAKRGCNVHVHDFLPVGKASASSAAGGIMHPLAPRGNFIWKGEEGYDASKKMFDFTYQMTNEKCWDEDIKLIRPLFSKEDHENWSKIAKKQDHKWIELLSGTDFSVYTGVTTTVSYGALIKNAIIIDSEYYLQLLWKTVQKLDPNAKWKTGVITDVKKLAVEYDTVILAAGISLQSLWSSEEQHQFFVKYVKGHNIMYDNAGSDEAIGRPLSHALLSGQYIVPKTIRTPSSLTSSASTSPIPTSSLSKHHILLCGATHDHIAITEQSDLIALMTQVPEITEAESQLREKLSKLYPAIPSLSVMGVNAGIRLVTERSNLGKIPIVGRHPRMSNVWVVGGLGSRGLVYHALMASYVAEAIEKNDEEMIPSPLHPLSHYRR